MTWIAEAAAAAALGTEMPIAGDGAQRRSARRVTVVIDAIRSAR